MEELHAAAWPLVETILSRERASAIGRFEELHGMGLASNNPVKIEEAARHGRAIEMSDSGIPDNQVEPGDQLDPEERALGLTHADQLRDLVAVVRARRAGDLDAHPKVGSADGRRVLALILGMYESASTDRPVRLV